jgi:hypothetical protein
MSASVRKQPSRGMGRPSGVISTEPTYVAPRCSRMTFQPCVGQWLASPISLIARLRNGTVENHPIQQVVAARAHSKTLKVHTSGHKRHGPADVRFTPGSTLPTPAPIYSNGPNIVDEPWRDRSEIIGQIIAILETVAGDRKDTKGDEIDEKAPKMAIRYHREDDVSSGPAYWGKWLSRRINSRRRDSM